jgi:hypothetical protein
MAPMNLFRNPIMMAPRAIHSAVPLAVPRDELVALGRGQFAADGSQRSGHRHGGQLTPRERPLAR